MPILRTTISEMGAKSGKDTSTVNVRAATKVGAMLAARARSAQVMPLREQSVSRVENLSNDRLMDKWEVDVQDRESMSDIGR